MALTRCVVPGCSTDYVKGSKVILHAFPNPDKEMDRFQDWLRRIGINLERYNMTAKKFFLNRKICRQHFSRNFKASRKIFKTAYPTINLPEIKSPFRLKPGEKPNKRNGKEKAFSNFEPVDDDSDERDMEKEEWLELDDDAYEDNFVEMNSDDEDVQKPNEEIDTTTVHKGYVCDSCRGQISGYCCVQCPDYDLCASCESKCVHPLHYVLRVPSKAKNAESRALLHTLRRVLSELNSTHPAGSLLQTVEDRAELEVKDEPVERDDGYDEGTRDKPPTNKRRGAAKAGPMKYSRKSNKEQIKHMLKEDTEDSEPMVEEFLEEYLDEYIDASPSPFDLLLRDRDENTVQIKTTIKPIPAAASNKSKESIKTTPISNAAETKTPIAKKENNTLKSSVCKINLKKVAKDNPLYLGKTAKIIKLNVDSKSGKPPIAMRKVTLDKLPDGLKKTTSIITAAHQTGDTRNYETARKKYKSTLKTKDEIYSFDIKTQDKTDDIESEETLREIPVILKKEIDSDSTEDEDSPTKKSRTKEELESVRNALLKDLGWSDTEEELQREKYRIEPTTTNTKRADSKENATKR